MAKLAKQSKRKHLPDFLMCLSFCLLLIKTDAQNVFSFSSPTDFPAEAAADLKYLLQKSSGQNWELVSGQNIQRGFILSVSTTGSFKTGESCIITGNGKDLLQFQSPTINGLIFGVYRHLRDLGFKFYLPDEIYTIIPTGTNLFVKQTKTVTPHLRIREFFGTGGFGSGKTDIDRSVQRDWQIWKWRNGFGSEFPLAGHVGETFNLNNAATLEKNPGWTATPIKQNGQVSINTKLNYFNAAAVDFFTNWTIKKFTDKNYKLQPAFIRDMVSVEPADGGDYMTGTATVNGVKLNTVSDQVFYAANIAAEKLEKKFPNNPGIGVNLYAYSQHADVPSFPLHPRVFVQIIPYQFQNIAFGPAFIKRWSEKAKRFGLYDYYKYPDSHNDQPSGYTLDELMARALHAAKAGSEGTTYETSYSKFSTAVQLWVLVRYMADSNSKWELQYNKLITDLYGGAAAPVKKLFDLFYRQSQFNAGQLKTSINLVNEADRLNKDALVKKRIDELKLYLTYVSLYQESQNLKNGTLEQRTMPVFKMAWTLYEKKIIHSYRIMQLVSYGFLNTPGANAAATQRHQQLHLLTFPETDEAKALWREPVSVSQYSEKELNAMFTSIEKNIAGHSETSISNAEPSIILNSIKQSFKPAQQLHVQGDNYARGYFTIYSEKQTTLTVNYELSGGNAEPSATVSGTNVDYSNVLDKKITGKTGSFTISLSPGQSYYFINAADKTTYRMKIDLNGAWLFYEPAPRGIMAFINKTGKFSYEPDAYPCYFYVPQNTTEVKFKVQVNALAIYSPDGRKVNTTLLEKQDGGFEIRSFKVDPGEQGKIWKAVVSGNYNYQMLNIPDRWFLLQPK
ncbi:MAG: DUF4838 domain-containing protein [Bacteroidetes bacterium]|nr:MAG: DUF4838 domain-containing protein [Bacteroidota bacterium]